MRGEWLIVPESTAHSEQNSTIRAPSTQTQTDGAKLIVAQNGLVRTSLTMVHRILTC